MSKKRVNLYIVMAIYFVVCILFITFPPIQNLIDVIDPHIFGLPCSQFCILFASVMICVGLIVFYNLEGKFEEEERAQWEREEDKSAAGGDEQ